MSEESLKIVMYPWFAMGHLTTFLHISNKLAERGHKIFFILPQKTLSKLTPFNLHPHLISFIQLTVPQVNGLPSGTESTADVPFPMYPLLRHAMDLTEPQIETLLEKLKPQYVFFDFSHWLPRLARRLGIKSVAYCTISPASVGWLFRDEDGVDKYMDPPIGFPRTGMRLYKHEARVIHRINNEREFETGMKFVERVIMAAEECDALGFKSCTEMEGPYLEFIEKRFNKPVYPAGPVIPDPPNSTIDDDKWVRWLDQFEEKSVVFCAFGSEARLRMDQFQQLLLGLESAGFPFFAALKPPIGAETVDDSLPEGFADRIRGRGVVDGGWVQQQVMLSHRALGCFVTHCGWGSLSEAMVNECQLVLMPHVGDQIINARMMGQDLRVGVEVEKGDEDGMFSSEGVMKAIKMVMGAESKIGNEVRAKHKEWRDFLLGNKIESWYVDEFVRKLKSLLKD